MKGKRKKGKTERRKEGNEERRKEGGKKWFKSIVERPTAGLSGLPAVGQEVSATT